MPEAGFDPPFVYLKRDNLLNEKVDAPTNQATTAGFQKCLFQFAENELTSRIFSGRNQSNGAISLREQFEVDISDLGDKIHTMGLEELELREHEIKA